MSDDVTTGTGLWPVVVRVWEGPQPSRVPDFQRGME